MAKNLVYNYKSFCKMFIFLYIVLIQITIFTVVVKTTVRQEENSPLQVLA